MNSRKDTKSKFTFFRKLQKVLAFFDDKKVMTPEPPRITPKELLQKYIREKTTPENLTQTIELGAVILKDSKNTLDTTLGKSIVEKTITSELKLTAKNTYQLMLLMDTLNLPEWVHVRYKDWHRLNFDNYNIIFTGNQIEKLPMDLFLSDMDLTLQNIYDANFHTVLKQMRRQLKIFQDIFSDSIAVVTPFPKVLTLLIAQYLLSMYAENQEKSKYQAYCYAQAAQESLKAQEYDNGLIQIDMALKKHDQNPQYFYIRALIYSYQEKYDQAIADIDKAMPLVKELVKNLTCEINNKTLFSDLYFIKGKVLLKQNKLEDAIKAFKSAIALTEKDPHHLRSQILDILRIQLTGDYIKTTDMTFLEDALKPQTNLHKLLTQLVAKHPTSTIFADIEKKLGVLQQSQLSMSRK